MEKKLEVKHYRLQEPGIRYLNRQPPLWIKLNIWNKLCWCGTKPEKPRRKWCCQTHADLWYFSIRGYWAGVRYGVIQLHNFTCNDCGFQSKKDSDFDVDHELAIALGGMCYDIDNLRPLCKKCHKKKTKEDMGKLKHQRKSKEISKLEAYT